MCKGGLRCYELPKGASDLKTLNSLASYKAASKLFRNPRQGYEFIWDNKYETDMKKWMVYNLLVV